MKGPKERVRQIAGIACCVLYLVVRLLLVPPDSGENGNLNEMLIGAAVAFLFGWFVIPAALQPLLQAAEVRRERQRMRRRRHRRSRSRTRKPDRSGTVLKAIDESPAAPESAPEPPQKD